MVTDGGNFCLLHTKLNVKDLDRSIDFYTRHLRMQVLRKVDFSEGRFTLAFVGYGDLAHNTVVLLRHNWDQVEPYEVGNGFGHLAIGVPDIYGACKQMEKEGLSILQQPGPWKHGTTVMAFIEDPDGYKVELVERK